MPHDNADTILDMHAHCDRCQTSGPILVRPDGSMWVDCWESCYLTDYLTDDMSGTDFDTEES